MVELISVKDQFKFSNNTIFEEEVKPKNFVNIVQHNRDGTIVSERLQNNLIMTVGENYVGDVWRGRVNVYALDTASGLIAVGTGSTILNAGQSGLNAELLEISGGRMKVDTVTRADTSSGLSLACTFSTSGALDDAIAEVGLFGKGYDDDETTLLTPTYEPNTGALIARAIISGAAITKSDADEMTVTWYFAYAP
jgi:hypothetical protein